MVDIDLTIIVDGISGGTIDMGGLEPSTDLALGELSIGTPVPIIPSNYGLITWDGNVLTVS